MDLPVQLIHTGCVRTIHVKPEGLPILQPTLHGEHGKLVVIVALRGILQDIQRHQLVIDSAGIDILLGGPMVLQCIEDHLVSRNLPQ